MYPSWTIFFLLFILIGEIFIDRCWGSSTFYTSLSMWLLISQTTVFCVTIISNLPVPGFHCFILYQNLYCMYEWKCLILSVKNNLIFIVIECVYLWLYILSACINCVWLFYGLTFWPLNHLSPNLLLSNILMCCLFPPTSCVFQIASYIIKGR